MFTWPDTSKLPRPNAGSLGGNTTTNVIRTNMDAGNVRQTRRFSEAYRQIPVEWTFTDEQFAIFQGIFHYKISDGADFFTMNLPQGEGFADYTVRFTGPFTAKANSTGVLYWDVSGTLETPLASPIDESTLDGLLS